MNFMTRANSCVLAIPAYVDMVTIALLEWSGQPRSIFKVFKCSVKLRKEVTKSMLITVNGIVPSKSMLITVR